MNVFAKLFGPGRGERRRAATTVEITFNGAVDDTLCRALLDLLRQGEIRIRRGDDDPPAVPV